MAYALPLDLVPVLSVLRLLVLLIGIGQGGQAYGSHHLGGVLGMPPAGHAGGSSGTTAGGGSA